MLSIRHSFATRASLQALRGHHRKNVSKRVLVGVCREVPENTPEKSQEMPEIGLCGVYFDLFGCFRGIF